MNAVEEIIKTVKSVSEGKQQIEATHTVNNYTISIWYVLNEVTVTITDELITDERISNNISICLTNCDQNKLADELFREVVDLTARNYRGVKKGVKDDTLKNIRDTYKKYPVIVLRAKLVLVSHIRKLPIF
jgi:hypothetical protein